MRFLARIGGGVTGPTLIVAVLLALSTSAPTSAFRNQPEPPLTAVDFEKLKLRTLDEKRVDRLSPAAKKALGLPPAQLEFKQLVAGDATQQYFFMVRVNDSAEDVFLSIRNQEEMRIYLTDSSFKYRGGASTTKTQPMRMIPSGDPAAAAEFQELQRIWAEVAQSM